MQPFKALILREKDVAPSVETLDLTHLPEGNVLLQVNYAGLNYKDALAITHSTPVVRSFPMIPGVDLMGTVLESESVNFQPGDEVILTGWGVGEQLFATIGCI